MKQKTRWQFSVLIWVVLSEAFVIPVESDHVRHVRALHSYKDIRNKYRGFQRKTEYSDPKVKERNHNYDYYDYDYDWSKQINHNSEMSWNNGISYRDNLRIKQDANENENKRHSKNDDQMNLDNKTIDTRHKANIEDVFRPNDKPEDIFSNPDVIANIKAIFGETKLGETEKLMNLNSNNRDKYHISTLMAKISEVFGPPSTEYEQNQRNIDEDNTQDSLQAAFISLPEVPDLDEAKGIDDRLQSAQQIAASFKTHVVKTPTLTTPSEEASAKSTPISRGSQSRPDDAQSPVSDDVSHVTPSSASSTTSWGLLLFGCFSLLIEQRFLSPRFGLLCL